MKNIIVFFGLVLVLSFSVKGQEANSEFLKSPSNWEFERFALPPSFATNFPYKGVEELRFAPGMFNTDSVNYFSYAFVAQLENTSSVTQEQVKNYLLSYFKGLCAATAKDRKLSIDTSKISVSIQPNKDNSKNEMIYNVVLNVFGVFADGAPVELNAEIKLLHDVKALKTYLVFIASPQQKTAAIWKELYSIQKNVSILK